MAYAMYRMQPTVKPLVSIANFLYELKDLRRMLTVWRHRLPAWRNATNLELSRQFGWRPFMDDVVKILEFLRDLRGNLKKLIKRLGTVEKRRWRFKLRNAGEPVYEYIGVQPDDLTTVYHGSFEPSMDQAYWEVGPPIVPICWRSAERSAILMYDQWANYTMRCSYIAPAMSEDQAELRALLDYFGVQWDPAIIWNAIPWSFIVDWFYDVGSLLSRMFARPWYDLFFRVHDLSMGTKVELTGRTNYWWNRSSLPPLELDHTSMTDFGKIYKRGVTMPTHDDLFNVGFSQLQLKRIVLGAELLVARSKRQAGKRAPRKPQGNLDWFWRRLKKRRRNKKWLRDGGEDPRKKDRPEG
jgi:hypothetical protein